MSTAQPEVTLNATAQLSITIAATNTVSMDEFLTASEEDWRVFKQQVLNNEVYLKRPMENWEIPALYLQTYYCERGYFGGFDGYLDEADLDITVLGWTEQKYLDMILVLPGLAVELSDIKLPPDPQIDGQQAFQWTVDDVANLLKEEEVGEEAVPEPVARAGDPGTSLAAAKSVKNVTATHKRILDILGNLRVGTTDEEILSIWNRRMNLTHYEYPPISDSGLRTRRKELVDMGKVVKVGEHRGKTGRLVTIWGLADGQIASI